MSRVFTSFQSLSILAAFVILLLPKVVSAQISMQEATTTYTQNFDGLPSSGSATWQSGAYYFPGWTVQRTIANTDIVANNGSGNTGALYSYGSNLVSSSSDRALGSISSSNAGEFTYTLLLQNNTGTTVTSLDVSYFGEQWRISNKTAGEHKISFWYAISKESTGFTTSPASDIGWTPVSELDFKSPKFFLSGGALDGNAAENRRYLSKNLPIEVPNGYYVMLRWKDADEPEADHGLAVDDVSLTWYFTAERSESNMPAPLPVELVKFTGKPVAKTVELAWITASEEQNKHFEVERSENGFNFVPIGTVVGKGNTFNYTAYTYTDKYPLAGTAYYRLKQVDEDNSFEYSRVIAVEMPVTATNLYAYPSVTSESINIELPQAQSKYNLFVYDQTGRVVLQQNEVYAGVYKLNVASLKSGNYTIVLFNDKGKKYMNRFIKR